MKAIKYLVAGALMLSLSAPTMAQDVKSDVSAITKVIVDANGDEVATKAQVKAFMKLYKKDPVALAGLGRAFLNAKNYAQAKVYADMAVKVGKNNAAGYILHGDIASAQDNGGEAASWYEMSTQNDPSNDVAYVKYARVYQKVDPQGAVAMLEKLRTVKPGYPVDAAAGYMYSSNNQLKSAMQYYDKVSDVTTLDDYILFDYASTAYVLEDYAKSLKLAVAGIGKYPQYSSFSRIALYSADRSKDYAAAVGYGEKLFNATDTIKYTVNDYTFYADALMNTERYDDAAAQYRHISEVDPANKDANKLISACYVKAKRFDEALAAYKQYLEDLGTDANANDYRALADIYVDMMDGADEAGKLAALRNADAVYATIESKFDYAVDYAAYQRALIHYQINPDLKAGESLPFYQKYISIVEPKAEKSASELKKLSVAYQYLAVHYIQNDDVTNAKIWAEKLLQIKPEDETAKQIMAL